MSLQPMGISKNRESSANESSQPCQEDLAIWQVMEIMKVYRDAIKTQDQTTSLALVQDFTQRSGIQDVEKETLD